MILKQTEHALKSAENSIGARTSAKKMRNVLASPIPLMVNASFMAKSKKLRIVYGERAWEFASSQKKFREWTYLRNLVVICDPVGECKLYGEIKKIKDRV